MFDKPSCETCYWYKSFAIEDHTFNKCTLDFLERVKCVLNGYANYGSIEDVIIPPIPKEES